MKSGANGLKEEPGKEMVFAINKYLDSPFFTLKEYAEMSKKIHDIFFGPVKEKNMLPFIEFCRFQ